MNQSKHFFSIPCAESNMIQKGETSIVVARNTRVSCVDLGLIYNELSLHYSWPAHLLMNTVYMVLFGS